MSSGNDDPIRYAGFTINPTGNTYWAQRLTNPDCRDINGMKTTSETDFLKGGRAGSRGFERNMRSSGVAWRHACTHDGTLTHRELLCYRHPESHKENRVKMGKKWKKPQEMV